ncbi:MAG: SufD family Fe-S cluster assembly protein [Chlamydiia bacterium]|nr:SufD family Fe-S cluster assembly protein [Chlamydiia bacterium]
MSLLETLKPQFEENAPWKKGVWQALEQRGLPTKKWDAFKYSSLLHLNQASFKLAKVDEIRFTISSAAGIIALPLNSAMRSHGALLLKGFQKNLREETNPYALLNQAFVSSGIFLYVPPGKTTEMEWTLPPFEEGALHSPRVEIFLGKGAHLAIRYATQGKGHYFYNQQLQLSLDEGATASIEEHLEHSSEGFAMHTMRARLKKEAALKVLTVSRGAQLERHDLQVVLEGERSSADLKGLSLPDEKAEIHHYLTVRHAAPNCHSNQHYKTLLRGRSRASFEGKIYVEKEAQQTEAYQLNNNLLLSPKAQAMSKPNLEILADDVKASHGATCARPKDEELFYLQTRGLSKEEAEWHLAQGFCRELVPEAVFSRFLK